MGIIASKLSVSLGGFRIPIVVYIALLLVGWTVFITGSTLETFRLSKLIPNAILKLFCLKKCFKRKKKASSQSTEDNYSKKKKEKVPSQSKEDNCLKSKKKTHADAKILLELKLENE